VELLPGVVKSRLIMEKLDIDLPNAKLAYTIIQSLLDGHEALSDLLVLMSHAIDEDVLKAMTNTTEWEKYLESKRTLEITKAQIDKLTEVLKNLEND
jgi:hypothetical protein